MLYEVITDLTLHAGLANSPNKGGRHRFTNPQTPLTERNVLTTAPLLKFARNNFV